MKCGIGHKWKCSTGKHRGWCPPGALPKAAHVVTMPDGEVQERERLACPVCGAPVRADCRKPTVREFEEWAKGAKR